MAMLAKVHKAGERDLFELAAMLLSLQQPLCYPLCLLWLETGGAWRGGCEGRGGGPVGFMVVVARVATTSIPMVGEEGVVTSGVEGEEAEGVRLREAGQMVEEGEVVIMVTIKMEVDI